MRNGVMPNYMRRAFRIKYEKAFSENAEGFLLHSVYRFYSQQA